MALIIVIIVHRRGYAVGCILIIVNRRGYAVGCIQEGDSRLIVCEGGGAAGIAAIITLQTTH